MNKILKPFIKVCFINIYFTNEKAMILVEISKNNVVFSKEKKEFEHCTIADGLSSNLIKYLKNMQILYDFTYISILDTCAMQGAFSNNLVGYKTKYLKDNIISKEILNKIFYTSVTNITTLKKTFKQTGIDFILSPFSIIDKFKNNLYLDGKDRAFILNSFSFVCISIYNKNQLKFTSFFTLLLSNEIESIDEHEEELVIEKEDDENIVQLDDLDDTLFSEDDVDTQVLLDEVDNENNDEIDSEDLDIFARDMKMIEYLKNSISEYYKNELYDSDFIEEIIVYSDIKMSKEATGMIEDDMFLSAKVEDKSILNILNKMTREEHDSI